jgi:hypothetical protein
LPGSRGRPSPRAKLWPARVHAAASSAWQRASKSVGGGGGGAASGAGWRAVRATQIALSSLSRLSSLSLGH